MFKVCHKHLLIPIYILTFASFNSKNEQQTEYYTNGTTPIQS